ncbi:MAG: type I 3-dehydroquinate dehydratase [Prevotellaceae bacterium]|jgi:3-dehydroquinate dehydratase type I|nr:type I 3-dehydroquinate dehydratase [Prevotellaceae bacterium]
MKQGSICVSIGERTFDAIINVLDGFDFAEIRLDLSRIDRAEIMELFSSEKQLVATCREGFYDRNSRLERLLTAVDAGAAFVDVETEADDGFLAAVSAAAAAKKNCKLIVSYHNFENTPPLKELTEIVNKCIRQGADIVKLVTSAVCQSDSARVLSLYETFVDKNLIAFAMGDMGVITRIACTFLGAPYTYAAVSDKQPLAKGQISYLKMKNIFNNITV